MNISGIYQIQSKIKPERIYVGSAVNINNRWKNHLKELRRGLHHSKKLQRHFDKYGEVDLQFSVLLGCDKEDLIKTEQYFIDSHNPYFNICKIAGNTLGTHRKLSEETRKRMSFARIGKSNPNYGKHPSDELKKKMGLINKGNKYSVGRKRPDTIVRNKNNKYGSLNKGVKKSEEHKRKISESKKGSIPWNKGLKIA
jgi:group I intron endonuclease